MPKASVYKDDNTKFREHQIWCCLANHSDEVDNATPTRAHEP